jgi:hypothetical protein
LDGELESVADDGLVDKRNLGQRDKAIVGRSANPKAVEIHRKISKKKVPVLRWLIQGTTKAFAGALQVAVVIRLPGLERLD